MSEREVNDHERVCITLSLAGRLGPVGQAVHGLLDTQRAVAMVSHGHIARAISVAVARAVLVGKVAKRHLSHEIQAKLCSHM